MSRCTHGTVVNSRKKRPLRISEASRVPEFCMSADHVSMFFI
jgi:hypothetical protein